MPWKQVQTVNGSRVDHTQSVQFPINVNKSIAVFIFTNNQKQLIITRQIRKLSDALSLSGGIITMLTSIFAFFIVGYNANKYDLQVADRTFKEGNDKMKSDDFNFWTYVRFTIYKNIFSLTGKRLNWEDCQRT